VDGDDDQHALDCAWMLVIGMAWLLLFYLVLRPCGVIKESPQVTQQFLVLDLTPRFSYVFCYSVVLLSSCL
jgi:hypothetical protein